jgi:ABC-type multidrug transport system ATPase subunit
VSDPASPAILVEHLAARDGETVLHDVSLAVGSGAVYAILGNERISSLLLRCLAGTHAAESGRISILGLPPDARWRLRRRRVFVLRGGSLAEAARRKPAVALLESPAVARDRADTLREMATQGAAILLSADRVPLAQTADRIGLIVRGRVLAEGTPDDLSRRFHRIQYANRQTETRTEFGTELDAFHAVSVQVRGWGITAVVSNFDEAAFEQFRGLDGVENARVEPMTLEETFAELVERRG